MRFRVSFIFIIAIICASAYAEDNMGVFSVERRMRMSFTESAVGFTYSINMADVPAMDEVKVADANGDGEIDETEKTIYFIGLARRIREGLRVVINREPVELKLQSAKGDFPENEEGLRTVRADLLFTLPLPKGWRGGNVTINDAVFQDRIGARELRVDPPPNWAIQTQDGKPDNGAYLFVGPKGAGPWSARFDIQAPAPVITTSSQQTSVPSTQESQKAATTRKSTARLVVWALLIALIVGAGHALTPGHGKSLTAAYLVGQKSTIGQAALLGWVMTAIRTTPVFSLGVITLLLDKYLLSTGGLGWLRFLSALAVLLTGAVVVLWNRRAGSVKEPPVPVGLSFVELVGLSIAGGLAPSPSALALLLAAVSLGQSALGLGLVVAFGFGLEAMMTLIGLLRLKAPALADGIEDVADRTQRLPLIWGFAISATGLILLIHAIQYM